MSQKMERGTCRTCFNLKLEVNQLKDRVLFLAGGSNAVELASILQEKEKELETEKIKLKKIEAHVQPFLKQYEELNDHNSALKNKLTATEAELQNLRTLLSEEQGAMLALQARAIDDKNTLEQHEKHIQKMQERLTEMESVKCKLHEANLTNANLNELVSTLQGKCSGLEASLQKKTNEYVDLEARKKDQANRSKEMKVELEKKLADERLKSNELRQSLEEMKSIVQESEKKCKKMEGQIEENTQRLSSLQSESSTDKSALDEVRTKANKLEGQLENSQVRLATKEAEYTQSELQRTKLQETNSSLRKEVNEFQIKEKDLQRKLSEMQERQNAMQGKLEEHKQSIPQLEADKNSLTQNLKLSEDELKRLVKMIKYLEEEKKKLEKRYTAQVTENKKLDDRINVLERENEKLESRVEKLHKTVVHHHKANRFSRSVTSFSSRGGSPENDEQKGGDSRGASPESYRYTVRGPGSPPPKHIPQAAKKLREKDIDLAVNKLDFETIERGFQTTGTDSTETPHTPPETSHSHPEQQIEPILSISHQQLQFNQKIVMLRSPLTGELTCNISPSCSSSSWRGLSPVVGSRPVIKISPGLYKKTQRQRYVSVKSRVSSSWK